MSTDSTIWPTSSNSLCDNRRRRGPWHSLAAEMTCFRVCFVFGLLLQRVNVVHRPLSEIKYYVSEAHAAL